MNKETKLQTSLRKLQTRTTKNNLCRCLSPCMAKWKLKERKDKRYDECTDKLDIALWSDSGRQANCAWIDKDNRRQSTVTSRPRCPLRACLRSCPTTTLPKSVNGTSSGVPALHKKNISERTAPSRRNWKLAAGDITRTNGCREKETSLTTV